MSLQTETRETVRCTGCHLPQFRTVSGDCRRCKRALPRGSVESTTVIVVAAGSDSGVERRVVPMRDVMQRAVVEAVQIVGATTKAARALGIPHSRLKQLLRESGDITDYRTCRKARKVGAV